LPALSGYLTVLKIGQLAASRIRPPLNPLAYPSHKPTSLRLEFGVSFEAARETSAAVRSFLSAQGVPDGELFSYELCVAEACYNAIEYAKNPDGLPRPVAEVVFTPEEIVLRVTDHTEGFAMPEKIPAPSPMSDRGRGLFIIQSIMDEVEYIRGPDENVLVMRKRRSAHVALQEAR
jgi:anti-sigma regulatory factor (Ser/Thr protein kinase)